MEILEFAKIQRRMCETYDCTGCPLFDRLNHIEDGLRKLKDYEDKND